MNETMRRELARLREDTHNPVCTSAASERRERSAKKQRHEDNNGSCNTQWEALIPDVTYHVPFRADTRVDMVPQEDLQHQITALREEVKSLRAILQRIFRVGVNGLQTPL